MNKYLIFALLIFAVSACDTEENELFDVKISWSISGLNSCFSPGIPQLNNETLEFTSIKVTITKNGDLEPIETGEVDCTDFSYSASRLERGSYTVKIVAMSIAPGERDSVGWFEAEKEINVPLSEPDKALALPLNLAKSVLAVSWGFDKQVCGTAGVSNVELVLDETDTPVTVLCSLGQYTFDDVGWDYHTLSINGLDSDKNVIYKGEFDLMGEGPSFETRPGNPVNAYVELTAE